MNARVQPSLFLQQVASENLAKIHAIISGTDMTPEQAALSGWWARLRRHQRRAMFDMAGIARTRVNEANWLNLNVKERAAIVLAVREFAASAGGIMAAIRAVYTDALEVHRQEASKASRPRIQRAA